MDNPKEHHNDTSSKCLLEAKHTNEDTHQYHEECRVFQTSGGPEENIWTRVIMHADL